MAFSNLTARPKDAFFDADELDKLTFIQDAK